MYIGLPSLALRSSSAGFSPASLFAAGEQGGWYDPSDISTMFQDVGGTTAAAVESPVGLLLDKRLGLPAGTAFDTGPTGFTQQANCVVSGGLATFTGANANNGFFKNASITLVAGSYYEITYTIDSISSGTISVYIGGTASLLKRTAPGTYTERLGTTAADNNVAVRSDVSIATNAVVSSVTFKKVTGNHLIQATAASRPTLSARYNRLTKTENFSDVTWTADGVTASSAATIAPDGTTTGWKLTESATSGLHRIFVFPAGVVSSVSYKYSFYLKAAGRTWAILNISDSTDRFTWFDLQNGVVGTNAVGTTASMTSVGNGWYLCSITRSPNASGTDLTVQAATTDAVTTYAGDGTSGIYIWHPDWRTSADAALSIPTYQRVDTVTSYDTSGFPMYLNFDGVDDGLATASTMDLSGTNKATVFVGNLKTSDASTAMLLEHTANVTTNDGSFYITAPETGATPNYSVATRGTIGPCRRTVTTFTAPVATVLTCSLDNSAGTIATQIIVRANGVVPTTADTVGPTSAGNFSNAVFYLGRRGGASIAFNGRVYPLIIRGAASTAAQIASAERYVGSKMGINL